MVRSFAQSGNVDRESSRGRRYRSLNRTITGLPVASAPFLRLLPLPFFSGRTLIDLRGRRRSRGAGDGVGVGGGERRAGCRRFGRRRLRTRLEENQDGCQCDARTAPHASSSDPAGPARAEAARRRPWCAGGGNGSASTRVGGRCRVRLRRKVQRRPHRLGTGKTPLRIAGHRPFDRCSQTRIHIGSLRPNRGWYILGNRSRQGGEVLLRERLVPGQRLIADNADRVQVVGDGRGPDPPTGPR